MSASKLRQDVMDELEFEPSVNAAHIGVVVTGGYGHRRLGEWMFGGMTRGLLHKLRSAC
ncbi:hypothetical protein [Bradyrhizobium elkanii]|uniref:hypothetical protein n=1 Tax=Bradyrhizobium elkanii TaxID=29448 RepID=UPI0030B93000